MTIIKSKENSIYKKIKKLKERKNRKKYNSYLIEGNRLVKEAFKAKSQIEYLIFEEGKDSEYIKNDVNTVVFSKELFKEISSTENPQGIMAVLKMQTHNIIYDGSFYLVCDKVQDPGNLGTIIRTAHAANVDGIILTKGTVDIYNDKTIRSTMGSMFYMPIIIDDENNTAIKSLIEKGFSLIATSLT